MLFCYMPTGCMTLGLRTVEWALVLLQHKHLLTLSSSIFLLLFLFFWLGTEPRPLAQPKHTLLPSYTLNLPACLFGST